PVGGIDGRVKIHGDWVWLLPGRSTKAGKIIKHVIGSSIESSRVVVLVRDIDFALSTERIVLARDLQLFNLQLGPFQIQLCCETIDTHLKKCEGSAFNRETSAKFAIASVHCSLDGDFPGKILGICAKQSNELAKLVDGRRNVAAKVWA